MCARFQFGEQHLLPVQKHTRQTSAYRQKRAQTSKLSFHRHHHCQIMLFPPKIIQKKRKTAQPCTHDRRTPQTQRRFHPCFLHCYSCYERWKKKQPKSEKLLKRGNSKGFDFVKGVYRKRVRGFKSDHALIELIPVSKQIGINVGIRGALFGAKIRSTEVWMEVNGESTSSVENKTGFWCNTVMTVQLLRLFMCFDQLIYEKLEIEYCWVNFWSS